MRIAMASLYLPGDSKIGVGYQVHGLANEMVRRGHDVVVLSPDRPGEQQLYQHELFPLTSPRLLRFPWGLRSVDWSRFDILHAHGEDWFLSGTRRPPHVRTVYGSCLVEALHITGARERARMIAIGVGESFASRFVAAKSYGISSSTRRVYPWLDGVIPCGTDIDRFSGERDEEPDQTVLFVGTFRNRKRGQLLHAAFERVVRPVMPRAKLWMVCDDAPPSPGVEVLGRISDADLADRYKRAWVFCLPSSYEGFGVPYVEAMAAGCPVVSTRNAGAVEVLADGRFGALVSADAGELGRVLVRLLSTASERNRLRQSGRARSLEYSWASVGERYEHVYDELIEGNGRSPRSARPRARP